ncbi:ABC transporter ATP-binding protein [Rhodoferax sp.]|uniref:energy-coupling factor ABC transporter ATP-binding protein n=1 Tax=Rhodoferax sp. TaxID=50421 RepID=UPI0025F6251A|nr:ABC transporter ATP-binding protein [Rhodoferax sp.]
MLSILQAGLKRGNTPVFDDLTLNLHEPRIGLIGDNGAGKSSLFRLACGLEAPHTGSVTVQGLPAFRINAQRPNLVGMMFQNPDDQIVFPTVQEELALGLTATGMPRREAIAQARAFLATRGLEAWAERAISSLSQGQRQHVCWLAILLCQPALILLDEPFASLDLPSQALLHQDLARVPQPVIVSTHVLEHLQSFDRVIWLEQGRVRADGHPASVCADYRADVAARMAARTAVVN